MVTVSVPKLRLAMLLGLRKRPLRTRPALRGASMASRLIPTMFIKPDTPAFTPVPRHAVGAPPNSRHRLVATAVGSVERSSLAPALALRASRSEERRVGKE